MAIIKSVNLWYSVKWHCMKKAVKQLVLNGL